MSEQDRIMHGMDPYRHVAFELLRIYLGIGLFVRGLLFFYDPSAYLELLPAGSDSWLASPALLYVVSTIHLIGGAMMVVGLLTRAAALIQIPILVGAVFLVHLRGGLLAEPNQSFEFAALVLFLLVLVFIYDAKRWSVDHLLDKRYGYRLFSGLDDWSESHRDVAFDLLRIYLGVGLIVRGALFISDPERYLDLLNAEAGAWLASAITVHYVALAHLAGGLMLVLGLLTRVAALIQIPILVGAVFLVHLRGGLLAESQSLEFSVLVLFLLVLIFLYGSGRLSADHYVFDREPEPEPIVETHHVTSAPVRAPARQQLRRRRASAPVGRWARLRGRPWTMGEVTGVAALGALGLVLVLLLFVPFTLSAAELLLIFALIVFLSFIFASFYKQWAHSNLLMDEPPEQEQTEENRHTGTPRSTNPREEAEVS